LRVTKQMISKTVKIFLLASAMLLATSACRSKVTATIRSGVVTKCVASVEKTCAIVLSKSSIEILTGESVDVTSSFDFNGVKTVTPSKGLNWTGCDASILNIETGTGDVKLTGVGKGTCTLTATSSGATSATIAVVVGLPIKSIAVSPLSSSSSAGSTLNFTAQATLQDDSLQDVTSSVVWSSEPSAAVTFSTTTAGRATIAGSGTIAVFAKKSDVTGEASITSSSTTLTSIFLIDSGIPNYMGVVKKYQAIGLYSDGTTQDLSDSVAWTSSNTSKANVDDSASKGLTSLLDSGSTTMTAEYESISGTRSLNVATPTLSSLSISPANLPVASGYKSSYKVTGTYSDGVKIDLTSSATWTSSRISLALSRRVEI
jgi:hypothetical protein